jgi:peptidoglycan hydrolase-like protein with peptidoglycan-binding domain
MIGAQTRAAIREFQTSIGMSADGRAGARVLEALRASAPQR